MRLLIHLPVLITSAFRHARMTILHALHHFEVNLSAFQRISELYRSGNENLQKDMNHSIHRHNPSPKIIPITRLALRLQKIDSRLTDIRSYQSSQIVAWDTTECVSGTFVKFLSLSWDLHIVAWLQCLPFLLEQTLSYSPLRENCPIYSCNVLGPHRAGRWSILRLNCTP